MDKEIVSRRSRQSRKNNKFYTINKEIIILLSVIIATVMNVGFMIPFWGSLGYQTNVYIQSVFITLTVFTIYIVFNVIFHNKSVLNYIDNFMIIYFLFIIGVTFFKSSLYSMSFCFNPFTTFIGFIKEGSPFAIVNILGNLAMYIPFGFYFRYKSRHSNKKLIKLFIIYIVIVEFTQGLTKTGTCDTNDMLVNTIGFMIGLILYNKFKKNLL